MTNGIITLKADKLLIGPLTLRARVHNGRVVDTELLMAGRVWAVAQLLDHERAWYEAAMAEVKAEAAGGAQ